MSSLLSRIEQLRPRKEELCRDPEFEGEKDEIDRLVEDSSETDPDRLAAGGCRPGSFFN